MRQDASDLIIWQSFGIIHSKTYIWNKFIATVQQYVK